MVISLHLNYPSVFLVRDMGDPGAYPAHMYTHTHIHTYTDNETFINDD